AWVAMMVDNRDYDMSAYNVTFAPGTRNNWHSHSVGQVLFCTEGAGYYQERGRKARRLEPGSVVEIPANTEHWHGAAPDSEFVHIGITPKAASNKTVWGGPVTDKEYAEAAGGK
ncbi:cupin domain-containing protein, partial [Akkermansia sp.]